MIKDDNALKTISEVSRNLGLQVHVIRFWEKKFDIIKPIKKRNGTRYYTKDQIILLQQIKHLLHEKKLTIKGAILEMKSSGSEKLELIEEIENLINEIKSKAL